MTVVGPQAYVGFRPSPGAHTVYPPGLATPFGMDAPSLVGSTTVPGLVMAMSIDASAVTVGSVGTSGIVVPDLHTATDPNVVIDPVNGRPLGPTTVVKDSTAGLQAFIDSTPNGSTIVLPFDLRIDGWITVQGGRTLTVSDPINGKHMLKRVLSYPWRVQPDLRATVNGQPNPSYNPSGICATWLYDCPGSTLSFGGHNESTGGGQANEPTAMNNPYGYDTTDTPMGSGSQFGGYDGTTGWRSIDAANPTPAGLNTTPLYDGRHFYTRLTAPFRQSMVGKVLTVLSSNRTLGPNQLWGFGNGTVIAGSLNTARLPTGSTGFFTDEMIGATISSNNDPTLFPAGALITAVAADGSSATVSVNAKHTTTAANFVVTWPFPVTNWDKFIVAVAADGKSVTLENDVGVVHTDAVTGCSNWCVNASKASGWAAVFLPNPAWGATYFTGTYQAFYNANEYATRVGNFAPVVYLRDTSTLKGIVVEGPNVNWQVSISAFDRSEPVVNELQHCVDAVGAYNPNTGVRAQIVNCELRFPFGDCEFGAADLHATYFHDSGRQGCCGHTAAPSGKTVDQCTVERNHHSAMDVEAPGSSPAVSTIKWTNNCMGGPHGIAIATPINGFQFTGNHSTLADVSSGRIQSLAPPTRIGVWAPSGASSNWNLSFNAFDFGMPGDHPDELNDYAYKVENVNGVFVVYNAGPGTTKFFLGTHNCTSVTHNNNNGGPDCLGDGTSF